MRFALAAAVAVGLLVVFVGGLVVFFLVSEGAGSCTEDERKVYAEFPHYGGVTKEPEPGVYGGCTVIYNAPDSPAKVAKYYTEQLEAHGWEAKQRQFGITLEDDPHAKEKVQGMEIIAKRDGNVYSVEMEPLKIYIPPRPGTHVLVHLGSKNK